MKTARSAGRPDDAAKRVKAYLASLQPQARRELQKLRDAIRTAVPDAVEAISYGIPTFKVDGRPLIYAAAWKEHTSLYPITGFVRQAVGQLGSYDAGKGTVRFPLDEPLPMALVRRIIKARVAELGAGKTAKGKRTSTAARGTAGRGSVDVDAYLASLPADQRAALQKLRKTIASAAPDAEEGFSYGLPAFRVRGRPLVCYGASTNHCSFYPMSPAVLHANAGKLKGYELSKGTIRFVPGTPLPAAVVRTIVKARLSELSSAKGAGQVSGRRSAVRQQ
jgi:uncharacterized protein YdhG (YjbR/CyaY superfamily)